MEQASDRVVVLEDLLVSQRNRGSDAISILQDAHTRWAPHPSYIEFPVHTLTHTRWISWMVS